MNLVFYDDNKNIVEIIEDIQNLFIDADNIEWESGKMTGIKLHFLLLDDGAEIGETVTSELIALDKSYEFTKVDLAEENRILREKLEMTDLALMDFVEMVLGGMRGE